MESEQTSREHLLSMLKDFDTGILATHVQNRTIRGRPMGLAEVTDGGEVFVCTHLNSPKVAEIAQHPSVALLLQDSKRWVSLSGRARIVLDRALIEKLWSESWKLWFPKGKTDPDLALIAIDIEEGEYWDNSGTRGLRFAIEAAKAYVKGTVPEDKVDQNAKVVL